MNEAIKNLVRLYHEDKLSHAYLLATNNILECLNDLKIAIKQISCNEEYQENCNKCNICNLIDQHYLPSLIIIEPDGKGIKKEQILELKRIFSTKPIYTKENIYIIKNADALNASSANTMLKFLEEPEDNIIGFFITNNVNNVINTIKSRCEILNVFYDVHELNIDSVDSDENKPYLEVAKNYIKKIEVEKNMGIMYNKSELLNIYSEREDIKKVFQILVIIYEELLKYKLNLNNLFSKLDMNYLEFLSYKDVLYRINLLNKFLDEIKNNANIELLLDKFVIEMEMSS